MLFWKSKIEKAFNFLRKNGFHLKKYTRNTDEECVYTKKNIVVEVDHYLSVFSDGNTGICVGVTLYIGSMRNNILYCNNIFDINLLNALRSDIESATPSGQISIYADFIKSNLDVILQYLK